MYIELHQPIKTAKRLGMSWHIQLRIAATIAWMWFVWWVSDTVNRCTTGFDPIDAFWIHWGPGQAEFGYWGWDRERHQITSVGFSFVEAEARLKGVSAMFTTCDGRRLQLACGCQNHVRWLTQGSPFAEAKDEPKCDYCGKYHKVEPEEFDRYQDCALHQPFFARWPEARGHLGLWERELCPSSASRLLYKRLKQGPLTSSQQEELCRVIARSGFYSYDQATLPGLEPEFRDMLAASVRVTYQAEHLLGEYHRAQLDLGGSAVRHLERVIAFRSILCWLTRVFAGLSIITAWVWHFPDWRTTIVLAATAVFIWAISQAGEWLK